MAEGIRFKNERQFMKALKDADADAAKELRKAARLAALPVAQEAQRLASSHGFSGPTVTGLRAGSRHGIGIVRESNRKTTGNRADFGATLMRYSLLPAVDARTPQVERAMEAALDKAISTFNKGGD